jgi:hypothetical protein
MCFAGQVTFKVDAGFYALLLTLLCCLWWLLTVQAWFTSVAAPSAESGSISSAAHANAGDAAGRLFIETIRVLGMPALPMGQSVQVTVDGLGIPAAAVQLSGGVLSITGLKLAVGAQMDVNWQYKPSVKHEL